MAGGAAPHLQLAGSPAHLLLSPCTALQRPVVHDVNGYYAALGVSSRATRRELAAAYRARGGPQDAYLTYVLSQLLNPAVRAAYDARPPGTVEPDYYVREEVRRQVMAAAARRGGKEAVADIIECLRESTPAPSPGFLDSARADGFDESRLRDRQTSTSRTTTWSYAYLLLDSTCTDTARLAQWQHGVGTALNRRGITAPFAVGFHGKPGQPFLLWTLGGTPVVFLHEDQDVVEELYTAAATAVAG